MSHLLHWCRKCSRHTYWRGGNCQLCKQVRVARFRGWLIVAVLFAFFVWKVIQIRLGL